MPNTSPASKMMILLAEHCKREKCGGTLYLDGDKEKRCLLCAREGNGDIPSYLREDFKEDGDKHSRDSKR